MASSCITHLPKKPIDDPSPRTAAGRALRRRAPPDRPGAGRVRGHDQSIAIGRPAGSFSISNQTEGSADRIDYSVKTKDGKTFTCYMYSATGFQRGMSFGQTPHSDAVCIAQAGAIAVAVPCNALDKAAGRCPSKRP